MNTWNKENKEISVRFCGVGGMGVILTSIIFGKSAIYDNKYAIQTQSYGAEQRGTKVKSDVVISNDSNISYPLIAKTDILIGFAQDAFEHYLPSSKEDSIILINSNLIHYDNQMDKLYKIPANNLALEVNNERGANMVMLGALVKICNLVSKGSVIKAIEDTVSKKYFSLNIKAFERGYSYV